MSYLYFLVIINKFYENIIRIKKKDLSLSFEERIIMLFEVHYQSKRAQKKGATLSNSFIIKLPLLGSNQGPSD